MQPAMQPATQPIVQGNPNSPSLFFVYNFCGIEYLAKDILLYTNQAYKSFFCGIEYL